MNRSNIEIDLRTRFAWDLKFPWIDTIRGPSSITRNLYKKIDIVIRFESHLATDLDQYF